MRRCYRTNRLTKGAEAHDDPTQIDGLRARRILWTNIPCLIKGEEGDLQ